MQFSRAQALMRSMVNSDGSPTVAVPASLFRELIITALRAKGAFDEQFYLAANPDVRRAVDRKEIASGAEHYYSTGYFEVRLPMKILVDEKYYLKSNPDIEEAVRQGVVKNIQEHFETAGFQEGRLPHPDFSLF